MFMAEARKTLEQYAPGFDRHLEDLGIEALESMAGQDLVKLIRQYRLAGLWIPRKWGGCGINAYDGIRVQRAIGARSPSMAIMLTMHYHTLNVCSVLTDIVPACSELLHQTTEHNLMIASAFAEGRYASGIFDSSVFAIRNADGTFTLNGNKKPCSMTHCMDLIALGIAERCPDGSKRTGMAVFPAQLPGITRKHFWQSPILSASDSNELQFENLVLTADQVFLSSGETPEVQQLISQAEMLGLCWFEIMATASYLGIVSALGEKSLLNQRVDAGERARLGVDMETAQAALDGAVRMMESAEINPSLLARILLIRFGVQKQIEQSAMLAAELAGGLCFVSDGLIAMLLAASRCLAYHPISRKAAEPLLADWLAGG